MFNFFKKNKKECQIPEDIRVWMENSFIWLINQFGEETVINIKPMVLSAENFPFEYNGDKVSALKVLGVVASQMNIDFDTIQLSFYSNPTTEIYSSGHLISTQSYEDEVAVSGIYEGVNAEEKFSILVEASELKDLESLVAVLAHELAHVKIIGENKLELNDEYLTDLVTVFYGLGVFNANAAFKLKSTFDKWKSKKMGYFTQQEWGYALSLFAYIRNEEKPDWIKFLTPNVKSDFLKSYSYILDNKDKVLV